MVDTLNASWKNDKSGFGFRMLQKMGWKEEKGLGKNESGITNNIKVTKRENGLGLGVEKSSDGAGLNGWNNTVASFNDVLSVLKQNYGDSSKTKKTKKKKDKAIDKISIGLKYKKISHAKDLSNKSSEDLTAIFGCEHSKRKQNSTDEDDTSDIPKKKKSKKNKESN